MGIARRLIPTLAAVLVLLTAAGTAWSQPVRTFGSLGSGDGQIEYASQMAIGNDKLFVADSGNHRIATFNLDGSWSGSIPFNSAWGIAADATGFYVSALNGALMPDADGRLSKYSYAGNLIWSTPSAALSGSYLSTDGAIVYLTDINGGGIRRFSASTGTALSTWVSDTRSQVLPRSGGGLVQALNAGLPAPNNYNGRLATLDASGVDAGNLVADVGRVDASIMAIDPDGNIALRDHCDSPSPRWRFYGSSDGAPSGSLQGFYYPNPPGQYQPNYCGYAPVISESGYLYEVARRAYWVEIWQHDIWSVAVSGLAPAQATIPRNASTTLTATATVPVGPIDGYDWDMDGDGAFETTTAGPTTTASFERAGVKQISVRARSHDRSATRSTSLTVTPLPPGRPTGVSASASISAVGTVSFVAPVDDGGAAITSYAVTCTSPDGGTTRTATGTASPITVADLSRGHRYTCGVSASGPGGDSPSATSAPVDVPAAAPDAPTGVSASLPLSTSTDVAFVPPSTDGGSAILDYTATCRGSDGSSLSGSGSSSPIAVSNLTPGTTYTCTVRARNAIGASPASAASGPVLAFWASPPGEVGISINNGAQYTTTPDVTLSVAWPARATGLRVSNDGGFGSLTRFELTKTVAWKLDSSGPDRLPKTVYVRFSGPNVNEQQTFQDDIILDETRPRILRATAQFVGGASASARTKAKGKRIRVRVKARDSQSGVRRAQIAARKSAPGREIRYASTLRTTLKGSRLYLRVRDGAGNWSKWKTVRVK